MKKIKVLILATVIALPSVAFALTDDEQVEFMSAVTDGNVVVVKQYIESGKVNVNQAFFAWTPLLSAASKHQLEVVKYLAEHGADLNYRHPVTKMSAVSHAAYDGDVKLLEYLLQKGADPNSKGKGGVTPLRMARDQGQTAAVEVLIKYGAKEDAGCQEEKCF